MRSGAGPQTILDGRIRQCNGLPDRTYLVIRGTVAADASDSRPQSRRLLHPLFAQRQQGAADVGLMDVPHGARDRHAKPVVLLRDLPALGIARVQTVD